MKTREQRIAEILEMNGGLNNQKATQMLTKLFEDESKAYLLELIGEDQKPEIEKLEGNETLAEYGAHVNYIRNNLRKQLRKKISGK